MLVKWFVICSLVGFIIGIGIGESGFTSLCMGIALGAGGVIFRKWIARTFWK